MWIVTFPKFPHCGMDKRLDLSCCYGESIEGKSGIKHKYSCHIQCDNSDDSSFCFILFPIIHFLASDIHKDYLNTLTGQKQKRTNSARAKSAAEQHSCLISGNLNGKQTCKVSIHSKSEILRNSCKILGWTNSFTYSFSSLCPSSVYCPWLCEKGRKP